MKRRMRGMIVLAAALLAVLLLLTGAMASTLAEAAAALDTAEETFATVIEIQKYGNLILSIPGSELLALGFDYGDIVDVTIGGRVYEMPVGSGFNDVDQGSMICRVVVKAYPAEDYTVLAINMGDMATATGIATQEKTDADPGYVWRLNAGVSEPVAVSIAMKEPGGYYDQWVIHQLTRSDDRADYPDLTDAAFANFRAIEVGDIAPGRLFRSSSPIDPDINRNACADAAAEAAGIKTIVNLTDSDEAMRETEGFDGSYYSGQDILALGLGMDFTTDDFRAGLAEGMRFIAARKGPYLIHCLHGKDRTGFVAAILECLMGASEEEVVSDYMETFRNFYRVEPGTEQYDIVADSNIRRTLCAAFGLESLAGADLRARAEAYLKGIGLSPDEIDAVRDNLSE